ncbi:SRPBCC family protein [Smaragdicoccus niigatensis]|uniref:SRPBCC family protein n=1 Tax=Smaragdicoccus niigatensis TaxID=359359 RepID=UPI00037D1885|nr:SRPBCC family protein [Smaragdicoccus niigatensis]
MAPWFSLDPVDESFFRTAPHIDTLVMDLPVPAVKVWEGITNNEPLKWCSRLHNGHYTSPTPHGVGTLREIGAFKGAVRLKEYFFAWDDEEMHHSFYVTHASVPAFKSFAEDYRIEPTRNGCRFTWTFAAAGNPLMGPTFGWSQPITRKVLYKSFERDTLKHFGA